MAEPFGILGLVIPLLSATVTITNLVIGRSQQVPGQIQNLEILLRQMESSFRKLETATASHGSFTVLKDLEDGIARALKSCGVLLDDYRKTMNKRGPSARVEQFWWPILNGGKLDGHRAEIKELYNGLHTIWLELIQAGQNNTPPASPPLPPPSPPLTPASVPALQTGITPDILPPSPLADLAGEYVGFERITLCLGNQVAAHHQSLDFNELQVVSRGRNVVGLQFMCIGASRLVDHTLPEGAFPFINNRSHLEVRFLAQHTISITDETGHQTYQVMQPRYKFTDLKSRNRFRSLVYGRELVGKSFQASDITSFHGNQRKCVAKCEAVQFWRFVNWKESVITITFVATPDPEPGRGPEFYTVEWHLDDYERKAAIVKTPGSMRPRTVRLQSRRREDKGELITFESQRGKFQPSGPL
ncbi:hypothetical protein QBC43DRAFT_64018 [Cladorrhinum sp. PSN259]|nr:hypothetical protein QBC43DRAFT_64018 [Cladorrhinum sp. PSN259]